MVSSINSILEPGRRTLAAIVFTDVASFSALTQENEEKTLGLVRRDLALISTLSGEFDGKVLKSTGDGLLIYFESAVQAVACALKVQQRLAEVAKSLPPDEQLLHRIGIHLGDVFVTDSDVMGDGVNIAARLQTEAEPGGICISQTVFDVVKNRLALQTVYLGPRELKNIRDAVPVYQVLVNAQQAGTKSGISTIAFHKKSPVKPWVWATAGAALAVLALVIAGILMHASRRPTERGAVFRANDGPESGFVVPAPAAASASATSKTAIKTKAEETLAWPPSLPLATPAGSASSRAEIAKLATLEQARLYCLPNRHFSGMVRWLEQHRLANTPAYAHFSVLAEARARIQSALANRSREQPLVVNPLGRNQNQQDPAGREDAFTAWTEADGSISVSGRQGEQKFVKDSLPLPLFCDIFAGAMREEKVRPAEALLKVRALQTAITEEYRAAGLESPLGGK